MRNFIGKILIFFANIILFLHKLLIFCILSGMFLAFVIITMITFFDLINPTSVVFIDKWYWNLIICFFGGSILILTSKRLIEEKKDKKDERIF